MIILLEAVSNPRNIKIQIKVPFCGVSALVCTSMAQELAKMRTILNRMVAVWLTYTYISVQNSCRKFSSEGHKAIFSSLLVLVF